MSNFAHFILTRFNVASPTFGPKAQNVHLDLDWLKFRLDLFERYCAPSIERQAPHCQFKWLVMIHQQTPLSVYKRLSARLNGTRRPNEIVETGDDDWKLDMRFHIASIPHGERRIATTRFDSDDILHPNFVADVQSSIMTTLSRDSAGRHGVIDVPNGYTYTLGSGEFGFIESPKLSPFCTYVEPTSSKPRTALGFDHSDPPFWQDYATVTHIRLGGPPLWMQVIHARNAKNVPGRRVSILDDEYIFRATWGVL